MDEAHQILIRKLREHSRLSRDDVIAIASISHEDRELSSNQDLIRQGDDPRVSVLVLSGFMARYHLLENGQRQYLSYHMAGDMPDSQALFIDKMDHGVCAIGPARVASLPHSELLALFERRPSVAFAIWRETLIDAAIFRAAITNNSARSATPRMAHLFCELFYRARVSGLNEGLTMTLPITLLQLGETLGIAIATVNRSLKELRESKAADLRTGTLTIDKWEVLARTGMFNPAYLHLKKPPAEL